jgi:hypothetical protein
LGNLAGGKESARRTSLREEYGVGVLICQDKRRLRRRGEFRSSGVQELRKSEKAGHLKSFGPQEAGPVNSFGAQEARLKASATLRNEERSGGRFRRIGERKALTDFGRWIALEAEFCFDEAEDYGEDDGG